MELFNCLSFWPHVGSGTAFENIWFHVAGAKIMVQKTKIGKNSTRTKGNHGYFWPMAIIRQQIEQETCSNPLKMGKVL